MPRAQARAILLLLADARAECENLSYPLATLGDAVTE